MRISDLTLSFEFIRSSGPGGQNVNKVATAVRLKFDIRHSSLSSGIKERLLRIAGRKVGKDGVLTLRAQRFRTQEANRRDAMKRLEEMIQKASQQPRERRSTKPTLGSKIRRLEVKHLRGQTKAVRKKIRQVDE